MATTVATQTDDINELLSRWEALRSSTDSFMAARDLHVALLALRTSLRALGTPSTFPDSEKQLESAIEELQEQQLGLEEQKKTMLKLNLAVHSLITTYTNSVAATAEIVETTTTTTVVTSETLLDGRSHQSITTSDNVNSSTTSDVGVSTVTDKISLDTESGLSSLKDEVIDVYREWDDAGQRIAARLAQYSSALAAWRQWESGLGALQSALRGDERTLEGLNGALRQGQGGPQIAEGVRDVAKLLSEKAEINSSVLPAGTTVVTVPGALPMDGGSLSDSGISDGGSDWGLSERERRLGALRRLHRQLEQALAPGSAALQAITKRMEQAEVDLRALQISCKELIARTAAQEVARNAQTPRKTSRSPNSKRKNRRKSNNSSSSSTASTTKVSPDSGDPHGDDDPDSPKNSGWAWRVAKAAVPLQIALVALFCAACLLEPHCCDALNTWTLTLAPQLRYVRGPPPV